MKISKMLLHRNSVSAPEM